MALRRAAAAALTWGDPMHPAHVAPTNSLGAAGLAVLPAGRAELGLYGVGLPERMYRGEGNIVETQNSVAMYPKLDRLSAPNQEKIPAERW
jgi:hypothetical protein